VAFVGSEELGELLIAAGEAPPDKRILLRDPIAMFGAAAIRALEDQAWIGDSAYAAFAIRTIAKAGQLGARDEAIAALKRALAGDIPDVRRSDILAALTSLGATGTPAKAKSSASKRSTTPAAAPLALADLVEGECYRRADLHRGGLGGNPQSGISYPAGGTYCLLFSDASKGAEYGYHDAPIGATGYRYFGGWDGSAEMTMSGGNKAIVDRSPELYLFTDAACGKVYRGRYELVNWQREPTTRDGHEQVAIVFHLKKVGA
jgi:hypothetical protein